MGATTARRSKLKKRVARLTTVLGLLLLVLAPAAIVQATDGQDHIVGSAVISDDGGANNSVTLTMAGIPQPPDGSRYSLVLLSDDGASSERLGDVTVGEDGVVNQSLTSNTDLIASSSNLWILFGPPDLRSYEAYLPTGAVAHIRHILSAGADDDTFREGYLNGAASQAAAAMLHANLALEAANNGDLDGAKLHAEHVANIIDGASEDLNSDGEGQNPAEGTGLAAYAAQAGTHAGLAAEAAPDSTLITENAAHVQTAAANVVNWAQTAKTNANQVQWQTDLSIATLYIRKSAEALNYGINGRDANRNGIIEALPDEAGLAQGRLYAQQMATYQITTARLGKLPSVGDTTVPVLPWAAAGAGATLLLLGFGLRKRWTS